MRVFIGMETSGVVRNAFRRHGHDTRSADFLPSEDGSEDHYQGDVFEVLERLKRRCWWPDLAIFHPDCTYHTLAGAWAFNDPDYDRYPDIGYHQKIQPGTLVGAARRRARERYRGRGTHRGSPDFLQGDGEPQGYDPYTHVSWPTHASHSAI